MKILVLNCGSSSVKYQLIEMTGRKALARGLMERIGMKGAVLSHRRYDGDKVKLAAAIPDHQAAIECVLSILLSANHGVITDSGEIAAVGHRVVHGGEKFRTSVLINPEVMDQLEECIELAPLHNPHNIKGIKACGRLLPQAPQVAVFDTAFHSQMPDFAYLYGIPYSLYKKYGIRRYGFHGTSHYYISRRAAGMLGRDIKELKLVTCHLGNGCSMAAVDGGVSIDTSMGFTPVEGLLMGTRCGDVDPAALLHIMGREELSLGDANVLLNKHSGLLGISGVSNDMREILQESQNGHRRARLALAVFCYRVRKYIAAYGAAMGGLDGVVFTGGIGENAPEVRELCCRKLAFLGIELDFEANNAMVSKEGFICTPTSKVKVLVVPTNEELVIAEDTEKIVKQMARKEQT
ncbi:acetate kinase [candidate division KSB1 bacterium]|nr:acetate kinase [candidate division KSB1 bacterium]